MLSKLIVSIKSELETPRHLRAFGSGWLSGSGALLCGLVGLLLVLCLRYPASFMTPELAMLRSSGVLKPFLHIVLLLGYAFAVISLVLRPKKALGFTALALVMTAALLGGSQTEAAAAKSTSLYFGLDFFILNVLLMGFLFIPLERFFPKHGEQIVFRPEWEEDMFYYLVSSLFVQVLTFLTLAPSTVLNTHADWSQLRTHIANQPLWLQVIEIMVFTDFVQYWVHRAFHRVPFLWRFHAVHHSAKMMDWLAGARMHFIEIAVLRGLTAIPMFSLGFEATAIQTYLLIVYVYSAFIHANVGWDLSAFERFLVTPRFHHWHRGIEREAIDVNFAIHFPLLDWLFKTHHMPDKAWPEGYGVAGHPVPRGYWQQFLYPFRGGKAGD